MTPARATMAKYVGACVVVVGSAIAGIAAEPPASGDLFDIARGTTVTTHSAVESSIIESIFGATGTGPEPNATFFSDAVAGTIHSVEWRTASPVTLEGFNLHATGDVPSSPEKRTFDHFRLQARVAGMFQTVYDADVSVPYVFRDGQSSLVISVAVAPTTAQEFRAEFTQHLDGAAFGPRVVELDGFPGGSCGDANYSGSITASDALFLLQVGIGAASCPLCICDINANGSTTATDALASLQAAVGSPVSLDCEPCFVPGTTTTTVPGTTTTTLTVPTTTSTTGSTTTTTLVVISDLCTIDSATCETDACVCGENPGLDYHLGAEGRVSGPVNSQLRVNINVMQGGVIDCGGWTRIFATDAIGCDDIGCCRREAGDPDTANWVVFEAIDFPCFCPSGPPLLHNFLLQCLPAGGAVKEVEKTTDPCP
jgi:hypothetical protein